MKSAKRHDYKIPEEVRDIANELIKNGYQAYLVGGCVRDLVLGKRPKDWDITTNAKPEKVQEIFPESIYENSFGTVGVKTDSLDSTLKIIEITTYRLEGKYSDKRHPDEVKFAETVEEDLGRRDFTINAFALDLAKHDLSDVIDPYGGREDLENKIVRTVGKPEERFKEDALRLLRAARFAMELDFEIDGETRRAIEKNSVLLEHIAKERIRDEFIKIMSSDRAAAGIILLEELNLLEYVFPELREGLGCGQNKHHIYTVFEHNVRALDYTVKQGYSLLVRFGSLLHDVGKPRVKKGDGPDSTFYNHEVVGAKMALKMLDRLHFPKDFSAQVAHLVRWHLFYYNVGEVTAAGVRRFLARVGPENVDDLLKVREADRIGSGVPKAVPYKTRHLLFMIDKVKHDPLSPKMLKVNGDDIMKFLDMPPGPKVGFILNILLEEVIDEPEKNTKEYLENRVGELGLMKESELKKLSDKAKERKDEFEAGVEEEMKKKHYVK